MKRLLALLAVATASVAALSGPAQSGILSNEYTCTQYSEYTPEYSVSNPSTTSWSGTVTGNFPYRFGLNEADGWIEFMIERGAANITVEVFKRDGHATSWDIIWNTYSGSGSTSGTGNSVTFALTYNSSTQRYTITRSGTTVASNLNLGGGPATTVSSFVDITSWKTQLCPSFNGSIALGQSMSGWSFTSAAPYYIAELLNSGQTANFYTGSQV